MAIYSWSGVEVELIRPVTSLGEVEALESRPVDFYDTERIALGMYFVVRFPNQERLYDLAYLRADRGLVEINEAARAKGGNPK